MTQVPSQPPVFPVRPQPNIYTVLLFVAMLALLLALGVALWRLMSASPVGYGLEVGDLFKPLQRAAGR